MDVKGKGKESVKDRGTRKGRKVGNWLLGRN